MMRRAHHRLATRGSSLATTLVILSLVIIENAHCQQQKLLKQQQQQQPFKLVLPASVLQSPAQGPGVDLVALNVRRFEHDHHHKQRYRPNNPRVVFRDDSLDTEADDERSLARSRLIEASVAALPERLLSQLPDELVNQVIETVNVDASLLGLSQRGRDAAGGADPELATEDPDGASIERLTKSCLSVQASSLPADQLNVTFHLYTRANPRRAFVLGPQVTREELLRGSPFRASQPVKWITHGFHTNLDKSHWMQETRDKILAHEDANVILTDWRRGASPALAFYPKAAANAHVVAKMIVRILRRLAGDLQLARVHLIGHSLGAHIMGFVGSAFTEEYLHRQQQALGLRALAAQIATSSGPTAAVSPREARNHLIGRITACDPALPCFGASSSGPAHREATKTRHERHKRQQLFAPLSRNAAPPPSGGATNSNQLASQLNLIPSPADDWTPTMWTHLRPDSAILVEVMHSNPGVMGYAEPLGDFDFFPNGSERQPGCGGSGSSPPGEHKARRRRRRSTGTITTVEPAQAQGNTSSRATTTPIRHANGTAQVARIERRQQQQGGLMQTLTQFIQPIRDFFQAYTCSHHRSVEYMVASLYAELELSLERRLDLAHVCQLVGYRCQDYRAFKRGFCFTCRSELECRTFGLAAAEGSSSTTSGSGGATTSPSRWWAAAGGGAANHKNHLRQQQQQQPQDLTGHTQTLASQFAGVLEAGAGDGKKKRDKIATAAAEKRTLPSLSQQYKQHYRAPTRNQYFFDTRPVRAPATNFCLHHYHLLVRYRWFRIRDSLQVARFRLLGSLNDLSSGGAASATGRAASTGEASPPLAFHKFTQHTYTLLITSEEFLGKPQTLLIYGDHLRPTLIDYIQVSYLSNLDAQVRGAGSARLCRAQTQTPSSGGGGGHLYGELARWLAARDDDDQPAAERAATPISMFVPCPNGGGAESGGGGGR